MDAEYGRQVHSCQSEPRGRSAKTSFCRASDYDPAGKQTGNLLAMTFATPNDTPELNALKALFGAPISMGRGEKPVELRPAAACLLPILKMIKT